VGKKGKEFRIYKFRTCYKGVSTENRENQSENDPRITKLGRFLRRTRLDELPQLLNVISRDMSLVGPRPEVPEIVANYKEWQKLRLEVRPGITGLWQILGRRDLFLHQNLEYDFYYIKNRSLLLDLTILLRTLPAMIFGTSPLYRKELINTDSERANFNQPVPENEEKEKLTSRVSA